MLHCAVSIFVWMYGAQVCLHGSALVTRHGGGSSPPYLWSVALSGQLSVCVISQTTLPSPLLSLPSASLSLYHTNLPAFALPSRLFLSFSLFFSITLYLTSYILLRPSLSLFFRSLPSLFPPLPAEALEGNVTD